MPWWDKRASRLQDKVRHAESPGPEWNENDELQDKPLPYYEDDEVRRAIVHIREDVVLLVSYQSSVNQQLWTLNLIATVILIVLIYIAWALS